LAEACSDQRWSPVVTAKSRLCPAFIRRTAPHLHSPTNTLMNPTTARWVPIAFFFSFLAVGIPYWQIPYSSVTLPNSLLGPTLLLVGAVALALRSSGAATFWKSVGTISLVLPAAVFARIIVEGVKDPTSHNLWPFEIVIALALGLGCAFAGACAGSLASLMLGSSAWGGKP
jgi:hypothetical protein